MKHLKIHGAVCCFFFLMMVSSTSSAQIRTTEESHTLKTSKQKTPKSDPFFVRENVFVGGTFGLGFSANFTSIAVAPEAGYFLVPERLSLGGRFVYNYYRDKFYSLNINIFGGGPFLRGYVWQGIFGQVEYEITKVKGVPTGNLNPNNSPILRDVNFNAALIGGGYHFNHDDGFGFYIQILFNLNNSDVWIYPNPQFRTGFTYKFGAK